MSTPRKPTPNRSTRTNPGILCPRVTTLRGRIDELIRGTLQLAEKLPVTGDQLLSYASDDKFTAPHCFLIIGAKDEDRSLLLDLFAGQPISQAANDSSDSHSFVRHCHDKQSAKISSASEALAIPHACETLRHVNFIEAREISATDDNPLACFVREAELVFFAISCDDSSCATSWDHLATWPESELEKVVLLAIPSADKAKPKDAKGIDGLAEISRKKIGRVLPAFDIKGDIAALRDCVAERLLKPSQGRRVLNAEIARGEKYLRHIEDQIEDLNRKIRQQDRFMDEVERGFDTMRASFTARLSGQIQTVIGIFNQEAAIAEARLKKRLNPLSSILRLFTGGRVGIQMHSIFTERIQQAVMQIAASDGEAIAASCKEHHQVLKQKTNEEIGSIENLPDDVGDTLARAREHFLERIEHSAKRGVVNLNFRNPLEKMLRRRNHSLKSFAAVVLALMTIGACLGAIGIQWAAIVICSFAVLFIAGGLWVAWATRQTILNDFNHRLSSASHTFATHLQSEYETAIGTLLAEYAATLKPIRAHINREKEALTPLTRRWQELFLGFKALAQDL
ncbi:MAG: hypothetical protein ACO3F7_02145 [Luteolibacter sp.]